MDGPAGLVAFEVAARRDFPVEILPRQPDLDVVGLGRGKAHIPGAQDHHPVVQAQLLQHFFRIVQQTLQLVVGVLRQGELHQLHLVELVLANQAPDILAVGTRLGPETGGVGGVIQGQVLGRENFIPVDVGDRHLRGGDQEIGQAFQLE